MAIEAWLARADLHSVLHCVVDALRRSIRSIEKITLGVVRINLTLDNGRMAKQLCDGKGILLIGTEAAGPGMSEGVNQSVFEAGLCPQSFPYFAYRRVRTARPRIGERINRLPIFISLL